MPKSLYERLGGQQGIRAVAHAAVDNHLRNPVVGVRFQDSDVAKLKDLATAFFCAGSGGAEVYEGRDMRTAHRGMNVNEQEYLAVMDDVVDAMRRHGVGPQEQSDVVAILYSLKGEILRV